MIAAMPVGSARSEWDAFWLTDRGRNWRSRSAALYGRIAAAFRDVPWVWEFGFGTLDFARMIGPDRWRGIDVSDVPLARAADAGFIAFRQDCGLAPVVPGDGVCAFQLLSYLSASERDRFLREIRPAHRIVITDLRQSTPEFRSGRSLRNYLSGWFPDVTTAEFPDRRKLVLLAVVGGAARHLITRGGNP